MSQILILVFLSLVVWWQLERWLGGRQPTPEMNRRQARINRLYQQALEAMRQKQFDKAEKDLLSVLKIDDKNAAAYTRLGIICSNRNSNRDAIICLEIARALQPSTSSLHNLGVIYEKTGQLQKAQIALKQAVDSDNQSAIRYLEYAKILQKLGQNEEMLKALEKACQLEPSKEIYLLTLRAYQRLGRKKEAEKIIKEIKGNFKSQPGRLKRPDRIVVL